MSKKKSKASAPAAGADAKRKLTIPSETFKTSEGKAYKFNASRFMLDGRAITAEEALEDDKVLAKLVDLGAGVIEEVGEEEGGE